MKTCDRTYNLNDNFLDEEKPEKYWLLGILASDGCIKNNQIQIEQSGDFGLKTIQYIKSLLSAESPIYHYETGFQISYMIQMSSKKMVNDLSKYNIVPNKTKTYRYPEIPDKYASSFLAGYVEGDGCVTISKGNHCDYLNASFVGTKEFIEKCFDIIPIKGHVRKHSSSNVYEIRWYGEKAIQFCDWLYENQSLYHGYKYDNYIAGKETFKNKNKYRYRIIKEKVLKDLQAGVPNIEKYSKEINIPFQTIYKWRKVWIEQKILSTSPS